VANVGDSRAVYSENRSNVINILSQDHKPNDPDERKRIVNSGGYIYQ
jgi:serine/threonine protein phosphatase PrpC